MRDLFKSVLPFLALATAASSGPASAADANGRFTIRGVGQESCQAYLSALADPANSSRHISWLMGYVTAENRLLQNTYDLLPTLDGLDFVKTVGLVCRSNPQESLALAANNTLVALRPLGQTGETPVVTLSNRGKSLQVRKGVLQLVQAGLAGKGLYKGDQSGNAGADFYKAVEALQQKERLPVTGLPDVDTIIRAVVKK